MSSYFQDLVNLHPRTQAMVTTAAKVDWTVVASEVESLQLEYSWIKEYDPRFNVKYRDDKSYPWLAITLNEDYPRVMVGRGPKKKGVRYFGPYSHAWAIRETVDLLLRVFPMRSCSKGVFNRHRQIGRPCLLGYIGKCAAPCTGQVSQEEHRKIVDDFAAFLSGQTATYVRRLEKEMKAAAAELEYERAAKIRDDLAALDKALAKNAVVLGDGTDTDVIALSEDPLEVAVQIFYVRGGRIRGERGFIADKADGTATTGDLVVRFIQQTYAGDSGDAIPREILVPTEPEDADALTEWLVGAPRLAGGDPGPAARRQEGADGDGRAERAADADHAQDQAGQRSDHPQPGARGDPGRARPARGAAAAGVLRRLEPAGHRGGRLDGRVRGRPAAQERVPPVRDQGRRRAERRRLDRRGADPAVQAAARRAGHAAGGRGPVGRA